MRMFWISGQFFLTDNFAFLQHFPDIPKLFPSPTPLQIVKLAAENISCRTLPISWRQNTTLCQGGGRVHKAQKT
jgi:hypothetical protein